MGSYYYSRSGALVKITDAQIKSFNGKEYVFLTIGRNMEFSPPSDWRERVIKESSLTVDPELTRTLREELGLD